MTDWTAVRGEPVTQVRFVLCHREPPAHGADTDHRPQPLSSPARLKVSVFFLKHKDHRPF